MIEQGGVSQESSVEEDMGQSRVIVWQEEKNILLYRRETFNRGQHRVQMRYTLT